MAMDKCGAVGPQWTPPADDRVKTAAATTPAAQIELLDNDVRKRLAQAAKPPAPPASAR
jgi:hypothetical protein